MYIEKPALEFLIKRALTHLPEPENKLPSHTIENITRLLADDIFILDRIEESKIKPIGSSEIDTMHQEHLKTFQKKMVELMGVPEEVLK